MNFFKTPKKGQKDAAPEPTPDEDATARASNTGEAQEKEDNNSTTESAGGKSANISLLKEVAFYKEEAKKEKEGKRKLFHSLVKLAGELKKLRQEMSPLREHQDYVNQAWYQGGLWRAPQLLPGVDDDVSRRQNQRSRMRAPVSLSDLFFNLVIVTAFTRVGLAITESGTVTPSSFLYFAVFWTIWSKEASYSTRFDTTDLSAKAGTLVTCFAVLFASLSVSQPMDTEGGTRIMIMATFCSMLHCFLMARVFWWNRSAEAESLESHVQRYALFNTLMNLCESATWIVGMIFVPPAYRWIIFTVGALLALRIPRAFLANDFHAACTKRGVLFILLLGFMLQSVVVAATEFFEYSEPDLLDYSFIGASCLMLFCIKLLYVDDSSTLASDHALLVNRTAAFAFNLGQFALLFSTTIMGSGLTLLTHSYLAAAAALPGPAKDLVCGGFGAILLSTAFIKSMHLKRVPMAGVQRSLFIGAYIVQACLTVAIAGVCIAMALGQGGYLQVLMNNDVELLWILSGLALFLVILSWLDEGLELALSGEDAVGTEYLVHPFGFWCCLTPEVDMDEIISAEQNNNMQGRQSISAGRLSELSPLLGESIANMRISSYNLKEEGFNQSNPV